MLCRLGLGTSSRSSDKNSNRIEHIISRQDLVVARTVVVGIRHKRETKDSQKDLLMGYAWGISENKT